MAVDLAFEMRSSAAPPLATGAVLLALSALALLRYPSRAGRRLALWSALTGFGALAMAGREAAGDARTALLFAEVAPYARLAAPIALGALLAVHPRTMGWLGRGGRGMAVFIALAAYVEVFYLLDPTAVETRTADGSALQVLVEGPLRAFLRLSPAVAAAGALWCARLIQEEDAPAAEPMLLGLVLLSVAGSGNVVLEAVTSWGARGPGFLVAYHCIVLAAVAGAIVWVGISGRRDAAVPGGLFVLALVVHMLPLAWGGPVLGGWVHTLLLTGATGLFVASVGVGHAAGASPEAVPE